MFYPHGFLLVFWSQDEDIEPGHGGLRPAGLVGLPPPYWPTPSVLLLNYYFNRLVQRFMLKKPIVSIIFLVVNGDGRKGKSDKAKFG